MTMPDIELTSAELDELERLAKAAGGREWYTDPTPTKEGLAIVDDGASMWPIKCEWPQARFVASANPATILRLLSLARAGLEAGKAEESMREKAAELALNGVREGRSIRDFRPEKIAAAIRALPLTGDNNG